MSGVCSDWVVMKFGGTSVATCERWVTIADVVRARRRDGYTPFVVCSALSGISDVLEQLVTVAARKGDYTSVLSGIQKRHLDLAAALDVDGASLLRLYVEELDRLAKSLAAEGKAHPSLQAQVMASGELMATTLGAAFLRSQGLQVQWRDARTLLRSTATPSGSQQRRYLSAVCDYQPDAALQEQLATANADAFLTQGFIASNEAGETVVLGRGGSDTSAAYFAAKLGARRLEIWTDVPGLFTTNPRQVPSARLLHHLSYDEAQEIATMGAKVLHPRCLEPVGSHRIPLSIHCTDRPDLEGTLISSDVPDRHAQVKAVTMKTGITLVEMETLGMWQQVGFLADAFAIFKRHGLSVDLMATSETNVTVSLDPQANALDPEALAAFMQDLNAYCPARTIGPCAVVSLVGRHIRSLLADLGPAFEVFDEQHVYLVSQAASDLNFSFVVEEEQATRLVRKLHAQLVERHLDGEEMGPTWHELFEEEQEPSASSSAWWYTRADELLALADKATPLYVYDEATLRASASELLTLAPVDRVFYAMKANANPDVLRCLYEEGLGFECVSPEELERVRTLFPEIDPKRILFTPNFAPRADYAAGLEAEVYVTLDSTYPLEAWPELFEGQEILIRVDPGRGQGHHRYVRTAGAQSKFGVAPSELPRLRQLATEAGCRVIGLHAHVGSGITAAETWAETAAFLASFAELFPDARILNVGGGFGVSGHDEAAALDMEAAAELLAAFREAHPQFALWMEPGRFLVAQAGVLLARVTQVKQKGRKRYVGLDAGMNSLLRPALYGAYHSIVNLSQRDVPPTIVADVVGPICETGDVLGRDRRLPVTREGDVMLIATAGAYGHVMSSHYNLRAPASEVLLPPRITSHQPERASEKALLEATSRMETATV